MTWPLAPSGAQAWQTASHQPDVPEGGEHRGRFLTALPLR